MFETKGKGGETNSIQLDSMTLPCRLVMAVGRFSELFGRSVRPGDISAFFIA